MHAAPPVQAATRDDGVWLRIQQALCALAGAVPLYWAGSRFGWADSLWLATGAAAAGLGAAVVAGWAWRRLPQTLAWDGSGWSLRAAAGSSIGGDARLMIDLGGWMLVRFSPLPPSAPHWLALSRRDAAGDWTALRVALYARSALPASGAATAE
jgi:hypothetical protein